MHGVRGHHLDIREFEVIRVGVHVEIDDPSGACSGVHMSESRKEMKIDEPVSASPKVRLAVANQNW